MHPAARPGMFPNSKGQILLGQIVHSKPSVKLHTKVASVAMMTVSLPPQTKPQVLVKSETTRLIPSPHAAPLPPATSLPVFFGHRVFYTPPTHAKPKPFN